jgi:hypothetical protein
MASMSTPGAAAARASRVNPRVLGAGGRIVEKHVGPLNGDRIAALVARARDGAR